VLVGEPARRLSRQAGLIAALTLASLLLLGAGDGEVLVEDWSAHPLGARGIPGGWSGQDWGRPAYDFIMAAASRTKVLHLKSTGDSSTISKAVKVDLRRTPVLEWRWKVLVLSAGADARKKETDDQAVQLYVVWERLPRVLNSRIIGYIWDSSAPAGSIIPSQKSDVVTYIVVRSGVAGLGKWLTETRNVWEDYRLIYGEDPDNVDAVSIAIDSDDTRSSAEAYVGAIRFRPR
jgi:hypothetical protein